MVIDTSALLAILFAEPERRTFNEAIEAADSRVMSVATFVEVSIVVEARFGAEGLRDLDLFLERADIELVEMNAEQAYAARRAFSRFGKGRHAAGLNYGDCFAYALASVLGEPLLYKGSDFSQTDISPFVPPTQGCASPGSL
jgi:ribonuclease VapC